jgi:hypothetical protein
MISHYFILPTAILAAVGIVHYLYLAFKGKVKPNSVSWFFWGFSPFIAHMIMLSEGVKFIDSIPIFLAWSLNSLVFLTSIFNKNANWKLNNTDYIFAISAVASLIFWQALDNPFLALLFAIIGDICAGIPTLIKCWKYPETESLSAYLLPMPNLLVGLLVLPAFTFYNAAYTTWILFSNFLKVSFISKKYFNL